MKCFSLNFPYAYGEPIGRAGFRVSPEDFCVDEELGLEPSGGGEHVYLQIKKRGENTAWVAQQIADLANVRQMDVGYCGLKDRHAVTSQWFSVYFPKGVEPSWQTLASDSVSILSQTRHSSKLRRGQHLRNHFVIRLRQVCADKQALESRLRQIASGGTPNYFGEQRFGKQANNLRLADQLLTGHKRFRNRQKHGLILSAARSYLFNLVLACRVTNHSWASVLQGEVVIDNKPTAPLWGRGRSLATDAVDALEQQVLIPWQGWCEALEHVGLTQARRATVMQPEDFQWHWLEDDLNLKFALGSGEFATSVLREITTLVDG